MARRRDDLRRVEQAITRMGRIGNGREAARIRAERSGVRISRPGIAILAAVHARGPLRVTDIARQTGLEPPLVSREIRRLVEDGYVARRGDRSDGRAAIVTLTPAGTAAFGAYRSATDDIVTETFAGWTSAELRELAGALERVVDDFARAPGTPAVNHGT
ncbi:MAG: MarR family transcriptional regulator [Acidimicrobiales bacterium]|nr:MarR family transcriptional regulator [Acidimicrobiales bacterium]